MSFSNKLNSISQIISLGNAVNKAELNSSVLGFAKYKNDNASKKAIKSYRRYWLSMSLLWGTLILVFLIGFFMLEDYYNNLNNVPNIEYTEIVQGIYHADTDMIAYYRAGYHQFSFSKYNTNNMELKDRDTVNVYLNDNMEPFYISEFHNLAIAILIFASIVIMLLIVGIILIVTVVGKMFGDYTNWFIYCVLPHSNDPDFESKIDDFEYRKLNFKTNKLKTKAAKKLRKANRIQLFCGIMLLVVIPISISLILMKFCDEYYGWQIIIALILSGVPFVIIGVNSDYKARELRGIVAQQNYKKLLKESKKNIVK